MKFIAAVMVNMQQSPMGTRSRLGEPIEGVPVLRRCLTRLTQARRISDVFVVATPSDTAALKPLIDGLDVKIETAHLQPGPFAELVRTGRWWGLDGWRGGIGSLCVFDEDIHLPVLAALVQKHEADAVVCIPSAAALVHPELTDAMIEHYETLGHEMNLTFTQSPPGLAPIIIGRRLIEELAPANEPIGLLLAYNPDRPVADLAGKDACYRAPASVIESSGRLVCDTSRAFERVRELIAAGADDWTPQQLGRHLCDRADSYVHPMPTEIEIELATQVATSGKSIVRPCGGEVPTRGPVSLDVIRAIIDGIRGLDDVRVVLAGFGDPLLHPSFSEICRMLRPTAAAIAVRTFGQLDDADDAEVALFETPVDVIELPLDATTPQTYQKMHGTDAFLAVTARLEAWLDRRVKANRARPLVVPSFVKCVDNLDEMESFFETWQRRLGMCLITGHSDFAGQRPARCVTQTSPPMRTACRRVRSRMMVLADGNVTTCDQDYRGLQIAGRLPDMSLSAIWQSQALNDIRHTAIADTPLCRACHQWHRP